MHPIRRERAKRRWSLRELGRRSGVPAGTLSGIERGTRDPQILTLAKIAEALEVDVEGLVREEAPLPGKAAASPSPAPEEVSEEERRLSYLWFAKLLVESQRQRWEEAAEHNTFSYEAWNEAAEWAVELEYAFVDAIPIPVYRTGDKWLPPEERELVAEVLGNIHALKDAIGRAFHAYQNRFEDKGQLANVEDLATIQQRKQEARASSRPSRGGQAHEAG